MAKTPRTPKTPRIGMRRLPWVSRLSWVSWPPIAVTLMGLMPSSARTLAKTASRLSASISAVCLWPSEERYV